MISCIRALICGRSKVHPTSDDNAGQDEQSVGQEQSKQPEQPVEPVQPVQPEESEQSEQTIFLKNSGPKGIKEFYHDVDGSPFIKFTK